MGAAVNVDLTNRLHVGYMLRPIPNNPNESHFLVKQQI